MSKLMGNSTEALVNTSFSAEVRKEKAVEILSSMMKNVSEGTIDKIKPFIIASNDGKLIVEECVVNEQGEITLPEIKVNTQDDIKRKSKFVKRIVNQISPVLHADIDNVTYIALMRKDEEKLTKMLNELNKGKKPKLENRVGCIYLVIGDYEIVI